MTLTLWPTTSWSSRAIRARSSATASRARFALTFGPRRALPGFVGLRELAPEGEAHNPDDREDQADEDELPDLAAGIVADDDRFDADGHCEASHGLPGVAKLSKQEHGSAACEKGDEVK